mmetsp:Transcript_50542/g.57250  ORF Transcript_50542/g.57250 Transcript_50542/m.57250 type:complete len:87 (+) Transcript_50542:149-409(+)
MRMCINNTVGRRRHYFFCSYDGQPGIRDGDNNIILLFFSFSFLLYCTIVVFFSFSVVVLYLLLPLLQPHLQQLLVSDLVSNVVGSS